MAYRIRDERAEDEDAIHELTEVAFAPMPFGDGTEASIIRKLREDGDLTISLVADEGGTIVGHVAFSPTTIGGKHDGWFGLGPISVAPERQRHGIGKSLIAVGLEGLRLRGARGCALIGNPAIDSRAGFIGDGQLSYGDLYRRLVQWIAFDGSAPRGELKFATAFG